MRLRTPAPGFVWLSHEPPARLALLSVHAVAASGVYIYATPSGLAVCILSLLGGWCGADLLATSRTSYSLTPLSVVRSDASRLTRARCD